MHQAINYTFIEVVNECWAGGSESFICRPSVIPTVGSLLCCWVAVGGCPNFKRFLSPPHTPAGFGLERSLMLMIKWDLGFLGGLFLFNWLFIYLFIFKQQMCLNKILKMKKKAKPLFVHCSSKLLRSRVIV